MVSATSRPSTARPAGGQQRPGRTISLFAPELSHDIYAGCWCKPQRPGRHHLVFLSSSIVLCSALAQAVLVLSIPEEILRQCPLGQSTIPATQPTLHCQAPRRMPSRQALKAPNHRALCSHVSLLNFPHWAGVPQPMPKLITLSQAQDPFHASLARQIFSRSLSSPSDSLPTTPDPGFIVDRLIASLGSSRGPPQPLQAPKSPPCGPRYFPPRQRPGPLESLKVTLQLTQVASKRPSQGPSNAAPGAGALAAVVRQHSSPQLPCCGTGRYSPRMAATLSLPVKKEILGR